jgi:hypothetical protein
MAPRATRPNSAPVELSKAEVELNKNIFDLRVVISDALGNYKNTDFKVNDRQNKVNYLYDQAQKSKAKKR